MTIKKYTANTEEEAMLMAKEELGKDAIVMNVKTISPKGIYRLFRKPSVELTAAIDEKEEISANDIAEGVAQIQQVLEKAEAKEREKAVEQPAREEKEVKKVSFAERETEGQEPTPIEQKLDSLQELLVQQMQGSSEKEEEEEVPDDKNTACLELIKEQLIKNEVDEIYVNQLLKDIEKALKKDTSVNQILASMYQKIILKIGQPDTIELKEKETKFVFFIGPTGVGKTTTIAKIASTIKLGKQAKIALVTSDTYRIAAVEQLKTYANILGVPLKVVYSADEMKEMVKTFEGYDLVMIDTAGRSHTNKEQTEDIKNLIYSIPDKNKMVYLVLSATTKYKDLIKITDVYSDITRFSLIFTKLDETDCVGNLYNIRMLTGSPLSYTTCGQNVPDDISVLDAQSMAKHMLGGNG